MSDAEESMTEVSPESLCSYAATGPKAYFQPIFICHSCSNAAEGKDSGKCICESCAESCHEDHNVEFLGIGPSYCDCPTISVNPCKIISSSIDTAKSSGIIPYENSTEAASRDVVPSNTRCLPCSFPYELRVFSLPLLEEDDGLCDRLLRQAEELVRHSRETFWVSANECHRDKNNLCDLEILALEFFKNHLKQFQFARGDDDPTNSPQINDGTAGGATDMGVEWWVQVKKTKSTDSDAGAKTTEGIDLHYDKDEVLAETFDLGKFPFLSTVTYLTSNSPNRSSSPTLVFPHRYDEDEDAPMKQVLVSHPKRGKHLVFDGRLLHGAPSHESLRQRINEGGAGEDAEVEESSVRVTFLVNIWIHGKPSGVFSLDDSIRDGLIEVANDQLGGLEDRLAMAVEDSNLTGSCTEHSSFMMERTVPICDFRLDDIASDIEKIQLPFVSSGATWIEDDEDGDDEGLVMSMFCPSPHIRSHDGDVVRIVFESGTEPFLERLGYDSEEEEEDPEELEDNTVIQEKTS